MTQKNVKVALIQEPPVFLNLNETLAKAEKLALEAKESGAKIIVFPETWLPGYPIWLDDAPKAGFWEYPPAKRLYQYLAENSIEIGSGDFERLKKIAIDSEAYMVIGIHERDGGTLYNTNRFISLPMALMKLIESSFQPTPSDLFGEWAMASTLNTLDTPYGVLGGLICWEHWMPLARAAMHAKTRGDPCRAIPDRSRTPSNCEQTIRL